MDKIDKLQAELAKHLSDMKTQIELESFEIDEDIINWDDIENLNSTIDDYTPKITLNYTVSNSESVTPKYNYDSDSGFDLYSVEEVHFLPFERKLISTGLFFDIPEGYEIQVRSKSGLALNQGLMVLNSPGTVDQGYTGEIKVILMNMNNTDVIVSKQQKIAQAVLSPVVCGKWVSLVENTNINQKERGSNGFGSTGI
jgi:dUTP pyrophosphatase